MPNYKHPVCNVHANYATEMYNKTCMCFLVQQLNYLSNKYLLATYKDKCQYFIVAGTDI